MDKKRTLRKHIFICKDCGGNYFISRKECCPFVYKNIIDKADRIDKIIEFEEEIAEKDPWKDRILFDGKRVDIATKYLPRGPDAQPKGSTLRQYRKILKMLDFKNKVVIDYGCSLAHASKLIKGYCKHNTYIGVDISLPTMVLGNAIWTPDYLYVPDYSSDKCLGNIRGDSADLVIASRITQWKANEGWIANFLNEVVRVLRPNSYLYFYSNSDDFGGGKRYLFNYLLKNFTCGPGKQKPILSKRIWGNERAYLKSDKNMNHKKELMHPARGLFRLKRK